MYFSCLRLLLSPSVIYLVGGLLFCSHQWFCSNQSSALVYLEHTHCCVPPYVSLLTDTTQLLISIVVLFTIYQKIIKVYAIHCFTIILTRKSSRKLQKESQSHGSGNTDSWACTCQCFMCFGTCCPKTWHIQKQKLQKSIQYLWCALYVLLLYSVNTLMSKHNFKPECLYERRLFLQWCLIWF